jgi:hypothetical protein
MYLVRHDMDLQKLSSLLSSRLERIVPELAREILAYPQGWSFEGKGQLGIS